MRGLITLEVQSVRNAQIRRRGRILFAVHNIMAAGLYQRPHWADDFPVARPHTLVYKTYDVSLRRLMAKLKIIPVILHRNLSCVENDKFMLLRFLYILSLSY